MKPLKKILMVAVLSLASIGMFAMPTKAQSGKGVEAIKRVLRCDGPLSLITTGSYAGGYTAVLYNEEGKRWGIVEHPPFDRPDLPAIFVKDNGPSVEIHTDPGFKVLVDEAGFMCINGTGNGGKILIRCGLTPDDSATFGYRCNQAVYVFLE